MMNDKMNWRTKKVIKEVIKEKVTKMKVMKINSL